MAWKGYSDSGASDLSAVVSTEKSNLTTIIESFSEVVSAIEGCWIGVDADSYLNNLRNAITASKDNVENVLTSLNNQLQSTYEAWVEKQQRGA